LWGFTAVHVLVDEARIGVHGASENPNSKKKVCVLSKAFKARNTGVRKTNRSKWKKGGAGVYTLSDLTKAEHVTHTRGSEHEEENNGSE
jgi:hypothetical protein